MNGAPLLPQHGFPLRLIVPGWYGMASVKWLTRIEALTIPFDGYQQVAGYHYRSEPDGPRTPITHMAGEVAAGAARHTRLVYAPSPGRRGPVTLVGRAWSGGGVPIAKVEVGIDGVWRPVRARSAAWQVCLAQLAQRMERAGGRA